MKYFSTFSGIGGFEYGIEQATKEWECVGYSEIYEPSVQVYRKHYPKHKNYGDITKIKESELPDFDVLCGGFPCQAFSIAGQRNGFNDTRGTLFFDLARIIKSKKPKILLFENVEGLLSHEEGKTFAVILSTMDELGYDAEWELLYSNHFGIPQHRPRVYIIGHIRTEPFIPVLPIKSKSYGTIKMVQNKKVKFEQSGRIYMSVGIAPTLTKSTSHEIIIGDLGRTLTVKECERLQAFPDDWTKEGMNEKGENIQMSLQERYSQLGNAVTTKIITEIVQKIIKSKDLNTSTT